MSERYLYLNDDVSFISGICPSDFFTIDTGFKIYLQTGLFGGHPSPQSIYRRKCPFKCESLLNDGTCDTECNRLSCRYDGADCDGIDTPEFEDERDAAHSTMFYKSIDYTNILLNEKFNSNRWRLWIPHMPFMFDKNVMTDLQSMLLNEYKQTSGHKFRAKNDVQTEFSYFHFLSENPKYKSTVLNSFPWE